MMDTNKIGSGATIDELLGKAKEELAEAERHYAAYEKIPQDPRQDPQSAERVKQQYDILYGALSELIQLLGEGKINAFFDQPTQSYGTTLSRATTFIWSKTASCIKSRSTAATAPTTRPFGR